jgi:seryl-tRNA synthetase
MFDIKWICENPKKFDEGLTKRNLPPQSAMLIAMDEVRRSAQTRAQKIQTERNAISKQIGIAKSKGEDTSGLIQKVSESKKEQAEAEAEQTQSANDLLDVLSTIPNTPQDDVPVGFDESDNIEVRTWGNVPKFSFEPKEHFDLGETLGMMDFETATKISGARFVLLTGALARLERALGNFMLNLQTEIHGYTEVNPPALVNDTTMYGTGQLPKFENDLFKTTDGYWMIPTAEVPLTNIVAGEVIDADTLPRRYTAMTWCFRSEAGSAGRDTRGMIRQHQFSKVEMVSVTKAEESQSELERMTGCAEEILKRLGLPFRTVVLATGDMGFGAQKTYDIEVWLPGQNAYREISSCSNCGEFQARRMKARYREKDEKLTKFVHTLNGSGLAIGRTLIAIIENNQQADGSIRIPKELWPYMGGIEVIKA